MSKRHSYPRAVVFYCGVFAVLASLAILAISYAFSSAKHRLSTTGAGFRSLGAVGLKNILGSRDTLLYREVRAYDKDRPCCWLNGLVLGVDTTRRVSLLTAVAHSQVFTNAHLAPDTAALLGQMPAKSGRFR